MLRHRAAPAATILALALSAACSSRSATPPPADPDPERARAALATLTVANETPYVLEIAYRIAGHASGEVGIGSVGASATAGMAPVPASEPLVLIARTASGSAFTLPPRTFAVDGTWTWRIERGTRFVPPASS